MDLEQTAIERLRMASDMSLRLYKQPLVITYSGGKDSDVHDHVATNPAEAGAADTHYALLLRGAQRDQRTWQVDRDRRPLGGIAKAQIPWRYGGPAQG